MDVDECAISHRCNYLTGARCKNTEGAYTCLCPEGFKTDNSGWNCIGKVKLWQAKAKLG